MKTFVPGQLVYWRNEAAILVEINGLTDALIRNLQSGTAEMVRVTDLLFSPKTNTAAKSHALLNKDQKWNQTVERFSIIRPLLSAPRTMEDVQAVAEANGVSTATIYRWIKRYNDQELVSSLARTERVDRGQHKLDSNVEEIISEKIEKIYLTVERPPVSKLSQEISAVCRDKGLEPPHINTIYARVRRIDQEVLIRRRHGPAKVKDDLTPHRGRFPGADYPNSVVQIDHTPVDVIIVDDEHRLPIGRPFLTIALDVTTKMLTGFCMTLDHPSAMSAGLCIAHAVQRKEGWLARRDILAEWPIYGKMTKIHVDNAKEFQGQMLDRACDQHNIILEFRPKNQPNYGPHVERAFRTFMKEAHTIPGTTFSNVKEKMKYDSEGHACMTLAELETWFTIFVVFCYHHKAHAGINNVPPIKLYTDYVHGNSDTLGVGLPVPLQDEETFKLDFTPYKERTIQQDGVLINYINYYSPVLRKWIGTKDPATNKSKKFIFTYDPRDISSVHFLDPDTHTYVRIPYLNNKHVAISWWELKDVLSRLKKNHHGQISEDMVFRGVRMMREKIEEAVEKTRLAKQRRGTEKRSLKRKQQTKLWAAVQNKLSIQKEVPIADYDAYSENLDSDIKPFDMIEIG